MKINVSSQDPTPQKLYVDAEEKKSAAPEIQKKTGSIAIDNESFNSNETHEYNSNSIVEKHKVERQEEFFDSEDDEWEEAVKLVNDYMNKNENNLINIEKITEELEHNEKISVNNEVISSNFSKVDSPDNDTLIINKNFTSPVYELRNGTPS